jgi:hypothetical protein
MDYGYERGGGREIRGKGMGRRRGRRRRRRRGVGEGEREGEERERERERRKTGRGEMNKVPLEVRSVGYERGGETKGRLFRSFSSNIL